MGTLLPHFKEAAQTNTPIKVYALELQLIHSHTCIQTPLDLTAKGDVKILDEQCWTYGLQSIIWTAHQATQQTTHLFLLRALVQFVHKSDSLSMFSHPSLGLPITENNAFH